MTEILSPQEHSLQEHSLQEQLARLVVAGRVFWQLWHQPLQQNIVEELDAILEEWPLAAGQAAVQEGLALMRAGLKTELQTLKFDYADLFVGPDRLKAAPWGSVYLTEEQITFGETTLAVREFYRQHGMELETGEREPDDHIGLMFAFIAWLGEQGLAMDSEQSVQPQTLKPVFCTLRTFLSEHLLTWAPRLCELVQEQASTDFYKGLAQVSSASLNAMAKIVGADAVSVRLYR